MILGEQKQLVEEIHHIQIEVAGYIMNGYVSKSI